MGKNCITRPLFLFDSLAGFQSCPGAGLSMAKSNSTASVATRRVPRLGHDWTGQLGKHSKGRVALAKKCQLAAGVRKMSLGSRTWVEDLPFLASRWWLGAAPQARRLHGCRSYPAKKHCIELSNMVNTWLAATVVFLSHCSVRNWYWGIFS